MTNQQSEVLSSALLRNLAKKWWIVLIFALIGGLVSFKMRKEMSPRQRVQATLLSPVNSEIFSFLTEQAKDVQIIITYAGTAVVKVAAEADIDVESKLKSWINEANSKLSEISNDQIHLFREQEKVLQLRKNIACENATKLNGEALNKCISLESEIINVKQQISSKDASIKILDIRPFVLPATSFPIRDIFFGAIVGCFIGLMLVSLYIQLKLVKK